MLKRFFELSLVIVSAPLWLPLIVAVGIATWAAHGRPLIFRQQRAGLHGTHFELYKFRSMTNARGPDDCLLSDEQRLTRFGLLMRSSSLDELPSLLNILKGEMALVGPRPLLIDYLPLYSRQQARRHEVRPGLTGWAQVNGRNTVDWSTRLAMDVWYVENQSLWLDLKILAMTVLKVVRRQGINEEGGATMSRFGGETDIDSATRSCKESN